MLTFEEELKWKYRLSPADVVLGEVRGFWKVKTPCPGGSGCRHAFRGELGPCEGGGQLTISYIEWGKRDARGRFTSPYAEWERQKEETA